MPLFVAKKHMVFAEKNGSTSRLPSEHEVSPFYFYPYTHNGASVSILPTQDGRLSSSCDIIVFTAAGISILVEALCHTYPRLEVHLAEQRLYSAEPFTTVQSHLTICHCVQLATFYDTPSSVREYITSLDDTFHVAE